MKPMELKIDTVVALYDKKILECEKTIILLRAEILQLREMIEEKEGDASGDAEGN